MPVFLTLVLALLHRLFQLFLVVGKKSMNFTVRLIADRVDLRTEVTTRSVWVLVQECLNPIVVLLKEFDIAQKKAWTARAFDITTKDLGASSQSGDQFFGIHASNNGKVMIFAGGIPLKKDGKVVGAIGISGGSGEQDHAVAEAGASAL